MCTFNKYFNTYIKAIFEVTLHFERDILSYPSLKYTSNLFPVCHFGFYNEIENMAHLVFKCPLYNPDRDMFQNIISDSLKSFFQLYKQVIIRLYLTEATTLYHSRELLD